ncbi:MAG: DUF3263 domain-containing protein [Acidimicrobiales bacterium]
MTPETDDSLTARDLDDQPSLSERQIAIIEFEATWWMQDEVRDTAIRARFACSIEDYYQELNQLLDHPGALEVDPLVVRRLRRQRERRRRARLDGPGRTGEQGGIHA